MKWCRHIKRYEEDEEVVFELECKDVYYHTEVTKSWKFCPICGKKRPTNDLNTGGLSDNRNT